MAVLYADAELNAATDWSSIARRRLLVSTPGDRWRTNSTYRCYSAEVSIMFARLSVCLSSLRCLLVADRSRRQNSVHLATWLRHSSADCVSAPRYINYSLTRHTTQSFTSSPWRLHPLRFIL